MPNEFVAVTVIVYVVPDCSPAIWQVRAGLVRSVPEDEQLNPPGLAVAW